MLAKASIPQTLPVQMLAPVSEFMWRRKNEIHYIGGSEVLPAPLEPEKEAQAIESLVGETSAQARELLIEHNLRLVVYIAKKFDNTGVGVEDLISIGTIGLIKAINTFNPVKKIKLATYASRCIENEILMYFRSMKKTAGDVSLSDCIETGKDGNALSLMDVLCSDEDLFEDLSTRQTYKKLYEVMDEVLSERERMVVTLRYGLGDRTPLTQREIAAKCGISRSYVSRIEKNAIEKLRLRFAAS